MARMPSHPGRSPTLTGVTSGVSPRRLKLFKSLVSTDFTTRARALAASGVRVDPGDRSAGKPDIVVAPHRGCKLRLSRQSRARRCRLPLARLHRKVTTLLRLVTMSCGPLHLEISQPLKYQLRDIPL
ncbi:hypothetical protein CBM2587_A160441 [Cupriavidus taiwanensis]|uniref:Uncharacterized protein n=1 Tax=Cupriavidus taiwanensis TaxID=164546 RepID=A0A975WW57_9BURK|nr:hypothetical protein CBM2587_A160441 [Cupriavidus taiwanensis]